jgi:HK97 family phage major capsid protein
MSDMTAKTAPEIKAVPETMTAAFDDFMEAFEAFKETNDRRLGEIEAKFTDDVVTCDKMDRINRAMDEQKKLLDQLVLKKARPPLGRAGAGGSDNAEHKAAFESYIRRGDEAGLREIEAKAMSVGTGADGGYLVPPETDTEIGRRLSVVSPIRALATVRQVSGSVLKKPFSTSGMASGWVSETASRPQTGNAQLAELTFPTMELYAMPAATQALLDDAAVDIEAWISGEVDTIFAEQEGSRRGSWPIRRLPTAAGAGAISAISRLGRRAPLPPAALRMCLSMPSTR